jgi:putative addiction module CopG family antidote
VHKWRIDKAISWHKCDRMAFALAKENEAFIERMLRLGRFNNQSEVVRETLRRMEREECSHLNPPPLTKQQLREIYTPNPQADRPERIAGRTALKSIRKAAKKHRSIHEL